MESGCSMKHVLDGVHFGATWRVRLNRPCAAAIRPFCQITLITSVSLFFSYSSVQYEAYVRCVFFYVVVYCTQVWSRTKTLQYRCVDDVVRYRQVAFLCDNGETRSHRIRVVRSCKCKRYSAAANRVSGHVTGSRGRRRRTRQRKRKRSSRRRAAPTD